MLRWALLSVLCGATTICAQSEGMADPVLEKVRARLRENMARMPDYVCAQTIQRSHKERAENAFRPRDVIRVDVTLLGNKERYSWPDARKFEDKELRDMVGKGVVGTGNFALHARGVFRPEAAEFKAAGETTVGDRRGIRYEYNVAWENSGYRIGVPPDEEVVAFKGSFVADAETYDLLRLEVDAHEIPPEFGLERATTVLEYARMRIGANEYMLPKASELTLVALDGSASRNHGELTGCRQYAAESTLKFEEEPGPAAPKTEPKPEPQVVGRLTMELSLDNEIALERAALGDSIRAMLARPLQQEDRVIAPAGALVHGRIVRLERQTTPFHYYEVALQFDAIEHNGQRLEFDGTLDKASAAAGLIREERSMNPTFTKQRKARMSILAGTAQRGMGVLHWDAKHPQISRGYRMRWRVEDLRPAQ